MKRLLCIFLILSLLVVYVPAAPGEEGKSIPYSVLEKGAKKIAEDTSFSAYPAKRDAAYSYGIPGPLSEGQAAVVGRSLPIRYIMVENGGSNQALYTLIYEGESSILDDPNFDDEPVAYGTKAFTTSTTIREYTAWFDTTGCKIGTYTVLSFTVVNNTQIVESSATYTEIYVVDKAIPLQGYVLTDVETGKQVKEINLRYGEERTYALGRIPAITTDTGDPDIGKDYNSPIEMETYFGLISLYGSRFGQTSIYIGDNIIGLPVPVNVCADNAGHKYQGDRVRESSKNVEGSTIYSCEKCYFTYMEYEENLTDVFYRFRDLPDTAWYTPEVRKAVEMGLFNGLSAEKFGPTGTMTRAMLVTVLWRYAGKPAAEKAPDFTDVPTGQWYSDAVAWAAENGIVTGVGKGRFSPNGTITREQMATILYRYGTMLELDTSARGDLSQFADAHEISSWSKDALQWAVAEGIIGGSSSSDGLFILPTNGATRAQVAAVLVRTIEKLLTTYYEIPLPDCEVKAQGATEVLVWTLYEDGTLAVEKNQDTEPTSNSWRDYRKEIKTLKVLQGVEAVSNFSALPALREVVLADSVTHIHAQAFKNCTALETVRFSEGLNYIDAEAFQNCTALETLRFPDGLGYIEYSAFENCTALKTIELPKELCYLGWACFAGCTSLTELRLPDGFHMGGAGSMNGQESFKGCTALEKVVFGKGCDIVTIGMFSGCTALTTIEFAPGVLSIDSYAFSGCTALEEVVLPEQLQVFVDTAFRECENLKKVTMLNPCLQLLGYSQNSSGKPVYNTPFSDGCEIYGYAGSTAEAIAEQFGYTFHPIA